MNDSRLDAGLRPGISTFPMKHQILTIRLSLQSVFRFCRQIYTQPAGHRHDAPKGRRCLGSGHRQSSDLCPLAYRVSGPASGCVPGTAAPSPDGRTGTH